MRKYVISIHLFKEYARSATTGSDIARNIHSYSGIGSSVKLPVSESIIARALNRVSRIHKKHSRSPAFFTFKR